ncbi:MAG: penicillin-binding transpeptidase domain-containing protein, partial [Terrimicrobiaceae bacterium]|nr:penicillin-binding transpeptidase domain-containing protein [Terrimicrobiaceae bacterium]
EKAVRERNAVLARMREAGFITEAQREQAAAAPPPSPSLPPGYQENWAMSAIESELDLVLDQEELAEGGLRVETTLDPHLQSAAERALAARLRQIEERPGFPHRRLADFPAGDYSGEGAAPWLEGAVVALDSATGGIRALVGGRDYSLSRFQRAVLGRRQAGSVVKPFVFAAAFERGLRPSDLLSDARLSPSEIPRAYGAYDPANADGTFGGLLPAAEGLIRSRNTMSVRAGLCAGLDAVAEALIRAGIHNDPPRFPSVCLGSFESSLLQLTAAFAVFDTHGVKPQPYLIEKVTDARGRLLYRATRGKLRVFEEQAAEATAEILGEVIERGTAASARRLGFRGRGGGKTGTTNDYRDAWFVGFSGGLTCGVWIGFDQPRTILPGGTGADLALPVWVDVMNAAR